jgi:hypothetical protein
MQVGYGLFGVIVAGLLLERPQRLRLLVVRYRTYAVVMIALIWAVYLGVKVGEDAVPMLPWAENVRIFEAKGGDIMVQLAGITVFVMVGLMRSHPLLLLGLAFNAGLVMVSNRGGMVAYGLACLAGFALRPPGAKVGRLAWAFAFFLAVGALVGPTVSIHGGSRDLSVTQLWLNVKSIFGQSESMSLEGTKEWRMEWWESIYEYTVEGPYFWTGKGFGVNLAEDDGFLVDDGLRSPHNGHMTVLARMGVPGAALWVLLQIVWGAALLRAWQRARHAQRHTWTGLFAFLIAYWLAMTVNAAFDVYLEGPMGGIWFWVVWGVGVAAVVLHRTHPNLFEQGDSAAAPEAPPQRTRWSWAPPGRSGVPVAGSGTRIGWAWPGQATQVP